MGSTESKVRPKTKRSTKTSAPIEDAQSKHDQAILQLKVQRDRLKQYTKRVRYIFRFTHAFLKINVVIEKELEVAKANLVAGRKDLALLALRKKQYQEQLLSKTNQQILTLQQLVRYSYLC